LVQKGKTKGFFRQKRTDPENPAWYNLAINTFHRARVPMSGNQLRSLFYGRLLEIPIICIAFLLGKIHPKLEKYFMRGIAKRWKFRPVPHLGAIHPSLRPETGKTIRIEHKMNVQNVLIDKAAIEQLVEMFPAVFIGPCFCRQIIKHCDNPLMTCLTIGWAQDVSKSLENNSNYSRLSREELEDWLDLTDKHALIKMALTYPNKDNVYHICCCCDCCCISFREFRQFATPIIQQTTFVAEIDPDKCIGCFKCINERCRFRAILKMNDDGTIVDPLKEDKEVIKLKFYDYSEHRNGWGLQIRKDPPSWYEIRKQHTGNWKAKVNPNRCFGCGMCASPKYGCPQGAIMLKERCHS